MDFDKKYRNIITIDENLRPNFDRIKTELDNGLSINVYDEESKDVDLQSTLLSMILEDIAYNVPNGNYTDEIVKFFIDNGYDVNCNNGLHGALCLSSLAFSSWYGSSGIEAAKILLDSGADPNIFVYSDEDISPLYLAQEHDSDNRGLVELDNCAANYFYTLAEIFRYRNEGMDYHKLFLPDEAIGKSIQKLYVEDNFKKITNYNGIVRQHSFKSLFLVCEDVILHIDSSIGILAEKSKERLQRDSVVEYSELLGKCADKTITQIIYDYHPIENYSSDCTSECKLVLDDESVIIIANDFTEGPYPAKWIGYIEL